MRISLSNKILKLWVDSKIIKNESLSPAPSDLWKTAKKFATAISKMGGSEAERISFASGITKIYPEIKKTKRKKDEKHNK